MQTLQWAVLNGAPWNAEELIPVVEVAPVQQPERIWCLICLLKEKENPAAMRERLRQSRLGLEITLRMAQEACIAVRRRIGSDLAERIVELMF